MSELSPAARAILKASYKATQNPKWQTNFYASYAAAALRAAADHCHSQEIREADHTTRRWICVDDLLAIAAEFEAQ
jgi:hypothetical protein